MRKVIETHSNYHDERVALKPDHVRHLSGNSISKLCGLETANCLEELHVARQRLQRGQRFTIEQASIDGIKVMHIPEYLTTPSLSMTLVLGGEGVVDHGEKIVALGVEGKLHRRLGAGTRAPCEGKYRREKSGTNTLHPVFIFLLCEPGWGVKRTVSRKPRRKQDTLKCD